MARNTDYYESGAQEALENLAYQEQLTLAEISAAKAAGDSCRTGLTDLASIRAQRRELIGMQNEYAQTQQPAQRQIETDGEWQARPLKNYEDVLRMVKKSKYCKDMTMEELATTANKVANGLPAYDPDDDTPKKKKT